MSASHRVEGERSTTGASFHLSLTGSAIGDGGHPRYDEQGRGSTVSLKNPAKTVEY